MTLWRIKLNSGRDDLREKWDEAKAFCRQESVVGVGWGRPDVLHGGESLDEVVAAVAAIPNRGRSGPQAIRCLAEQVQDDDLIWTRDKGGDYWLGRINGPWRYDSSPGPRKWDVYNLRPCEWLPRSFRDYEVPGAVVRSFIGRTGSICRVDPRNEGGWRVTRMIWEQATDPDAKPEVHDPKEIISELLDPTDVEDVALLYLQAQGWLLMPSSRMNDPPLYEATLRHNDDGRLAVLAVKSGGSNPVPVAAVVAAVKDDDAEVFVFSTHHRFEGVPEDLGATTITTNQIAAFMAERPEILPPRITRWINPQRQEGA